MVMSIVKKEDSKKWINSFVAIISIIAGFLAIRFTLQMSEWFDLEAKVNNFIIISQGIGVVVGLSVFIGIFKSKNTSALLSEVYDELVKVVWPDKDTIFKVTVGIVISLSIVSAIFVGVDYMFRALLDLFY
ncbi:MAG: preprotein translocase subunit SecE [Bdellovibrionales bacterium CG12_big_fil_rev_8_21_14_0_65_38_15]|nr:MAG: preprotein translocase subunit SecE [Bdellovibrionales bacterium CG22_combo_CG10-13_8_21_14_all_38_13]PIQ55411.1 MAG: preprotein translocase subunit SecE [Bdellovibrionales bacterium CG12_big_fil_rev_8_21_14_0_65_38_15]PIR29152.1 MAG: preprotein translocase subunit SecE [Bdellovibrionales bacterium CG11_big_fil_rev_8_21_14_0_20_38_13]